MFVDIRQLQDLQITTSSSDAGFVCRSSFSLFLCLWFRSLCTGLTWRTSRMTLSHILWCCRSLIDVHLLRQRGLAECFCLWFELEHDLETQLQVHFYWKYSCRLLGVLPKYVRTHVWKCSLNFVVRDVCEAQLKNHVLDFSYLIPRPGPSGSGSYDNSMAGAAAANAADTVIHSVATLAPLVHSSLPWLLFSFFLWRFASDLVIDHLTHPI